MTISQGRNPLELRHALRQKIGCQQKGWKNLQVRGQLYVKTHSPSWSQAYADDWASSLENHVYDAIGMLHPRDVNTDNVLAVLEPIWLQIPATAKLVRNRIELILDAAKAKGCVKARIRPAGVATSTSCCPGRSRTNGPSPPTLGRRSMVYTANSSPWMGVLPRYGDGHPDCVPKRRGA
ncbi:phage integrase central domain-containing protein [Pseudomonas aeruginosa]|uniref:phage integrase central domain-containing protein n=1 Tax=Pseudomonas aeruginosa TaxID=287 RepID=UPI003D796940